MRPQQTFDRHTVGYTLLEMTLSLTLLSIIMVGTGSVMLLAAKASPAEDSPTSQIMRDTQVLARISEDLAQAKYILENTSNAVTIVVPDRTGDKIPDRLRYAWSGTAGDPLTYAINGGTPVAILTATAQFELSYEVESRQFTIPAPLVYGTEKQVASYDITTGASNADIAVDDHFAQVLMPALSLGAIGFTPTRVELFAHVNNPNDGVMAVELRDTTLGLPGSNRYATATVVESNLNTSWAWSSTDIVPNQLYIPIGQSVAMTFGYTSGSGKVARLSSNKSLLGGQLSSTDGGANWSADVGYSMLYRLYGQEVSTAGADVDVARSHVVSIGITLQSSLDGVSPLVRRTRLLQSPELLDYFWEADFDVSPTYLDMDGNGQADWSYLGANHIPDTRLSSGVWNPRSTLSTAPTRAFTKPTIVELCMCAMMTSEAVVVGPLHVDENDEILPITIKLIADGSGGQKMVFYNDLTGTSPYGTVSVAKSGLIDIKLILLPASDTIALWVEGNYIGSFLFSRIADNGQRGLSLSGVGNDAEISYVRIRVGGTSSEGDAGTTIPGG